MVELEGLEAADTPDKEQSAPAPDENGYTDYGGFSAKSGRPDSSSESSVEQPSVKTQASPSAKTSPDSKSGVGLRGSSSLSTIPRNPQGSLGAPSIRAPSMRFHNNGGQELGSSDRDISLATLGIAVSGTQLSYLNDAKQVFKYAQRVDGKLRSALTLTRAIQISSTATAKYLGYAGKALGIYGVYQAGIKLRNNPYNLANWVKFGANCGMLFLKANPLNLGINIGYNVLDQGGYIDDWIGN